MSDNPDQGVWSSDELPSSWEWVIFAEFWGDFTSSQKKLPQKSYLPAGRFPVIDQGQQLIGGFSDAKDLLSDAEPPAIVFGDHTRASKFVETPFIQGADGVRVLKPKPIVDPKYAFYALKAIRLPDKGYSRHFKFLKASKFPLAPEPEQHHIVAKLDSLHARSARARYELDHIPKLIERYKQAILAKAFSGELTKEWRAQHRILEDEWSSTTVGELLSGIIAGKNLKCEERPPESCEQGVIKVSSVTWGRFDPTQAKTLPNTFEPLPRSKIKQGDFLISRANTLELVGAVAIVDIDPKNLFLSDKVLRLEMPDEAKPWLLWFLRSPFGRAAIESGATGNQLSMRNLSQNALKAFYLPWPSCAERIEIVSRIERAHKWLDKIGAEHAGAAHLLPKLDQATLAKAFRGELVPQDPNDEPASVLLERIKAEQASTAKPRRRRKSVAQ